jgi:hypothetical protein
MVSPSAGHRLFHRFRVDHREVFQRRVAHALARLLGGARRPFQSAPLRFPVVHDGRAVGLGQPVEMGHLETLHPPCRRARFPAAARRRVEGHRLVEVALLVVGRVEQRRHDDRRAAQMRHAVIGDRVIHRLGADPAQADMRAGLHRQRPGEAPAVAVEHRQRPEIDRVLGHAACDHIAHSPSAPRRGDGRRRPSGCRSCPTCS